MRLIEKAFTEKKAIWQRIYLSDWFDPIYNIYKKPWQIYHRIEKFIYYGRVGSKCWDFDANCIHDLIYAHMKRVHKFMNSDKTHLTWNDNPNNKGMRKLAEFTELSKRMSENEMKTYVNYDRVKKRYPAKDVLDIFSRSEDSTYKRDISRAFAADQKIVDERLKRYYHLLEKDVRGFWD